MQRLVFGDTVATTSGFGNSVPVLVVIDKCERRVIGLQTGTLAQHGRNGSLNHGHQVTVAIAAVSSERTAKLAPIFQPPSRHTPLA